MFRIACQFSAALFCTFAFCVTAPAQLYTAPNISNLQGLYTTPRTVSNLVRTQAQSRLDTGFAGVRNPSLAPLPSMPSSMAGPRIGLGANTATRSSKPFSSVQAAPTVSPYLNLFRTDLQGGGNFNYSTLVQPQLQQQQLNQQMERQNQQTNRRLQSIAAQADYNYQGSKDQYPTGHQTAFGYTGHYYQPAQVKQKRTR
jgi:hypothetical protein